VTTPIRAVVRSMDGDPARTRLELEVTLDDLLSLAKAGALGAVVLLTYPAPAADAPAAVDRGPRP
jgi:hypothetical protein